MSFLEEDVFIMTWRISSFSMCPVEADDCIESPVFFIRNFGNSEWKLRLYPKNEDFISCYLICVSLGAYETSVPMFYKLSVNTPLPFEKDTTATDFILNSSHGYPTWIETEDVWKEKDKYLPNDTLTIICQMKCENRVGLQNAEEEIFETLSRECCSSTYFINMNKCCIETIIPVQTKRSLWRIPRFDLLAVGKRIAIPVFSAVKESPSFYVSLYRDVESIIRIEIRRQKDDQGKNIFVRCSVSLVNHPTGDNSICDENDFLFESDEVWKLPSFLKWRDEDDYFNNTCDVYLKFDFAFSIEGKLLHFEEPYWDPGFVPPVSRIPSKALTTPTPEDEHPIVSFRVGDQTFKVHKSVLKARSEVFVAMFENDMKEKATGVVDIPDVDPQTWGQLVAFLYLGSLQPDDLLSTDIRKLYATAQKYQVLSLIVYSSYLLAKSMTVLNVGEILILAVLHQDDQLLKSAIDFVTFNSDRILASQMWKDFMDNYPSVAANVMHKLLVKGFVNTT